jgi:hypothetical protein
MSLKERSHSNEGEPENEIRFQRGMSLQAKCRMLRMIEYSHELGAADPLASSRDAGGCDGQRPHLLVGTGRESVYGFIERVLKGQHYRRLSKGQKGIVRRFLAKVTALSRAQMTRLMQRWIEVRRIERKPVRRPNFPRHYIAADIATLAEVDAAYEDLSGPAVRRLRRRGWEVFGDEKVQRVAGIFSLAHLQSAQVRKLPQHPSERAALASAPGVDRGAPAIGPERLGICVWTRCIRGSPTRSRGCIT